MSEKNREYILQLFKIVSPTSILVVDKYGMVKRLNCPFRVMALADFPPYILMGNIYYVDFVKMTLDLKQVYIIQAKGYFINEFQIMQSPGL